jgi:nickel-dependent lactate racemase
MTTYYAQGSPQTDLTTDDLRAALSETLRRLEPRRRVLAIPPDHTRPNSMAGPLTRMACEYLGDRLTDVLPALGTHAPMSDEQLDAMFPGVPRNLFRVHDWRNDVVTIGEVPAEFVAQASEGIWRRPWPVQLNRLVWEGRHDLILSIGQVVPHEVIGMANYNKNLFVGVGGSRGINESHFIAASYGMERIMGRTDTPVRRILNYAHEHFCRHLPLVFVLTVVGPRDDGSLAITPGSHAPRGNPPAAMLRVGCGNEGREPSNVPTQSVGTRASGLAVRGLYIGDDADCFEQASALSVQVNFTVLEEPPQKIVVWLDPEEFQSTWLGNKSIYRTRMAVADGGELVVLAPGVSTFGEDPEIDRLVRKYGYCNTPNIMRLAEETDDLPRNLSAASHIIHGSSEGRFTITYCPGKLTREETESVGYRYAELEPMLQRYNPKTLRDGWNTLPDGERIYYVSNPALGLWAYRGRVSK